MVSSLQRTKVWFAATIVAILALFFAMSGPVSAANPSTISFQGKVVNANGTNVADGSYGFVFKIYTVSSSGTAIWTESDALTVTSGVFQVNLGAVCPFFTANACNGSTPIDFNASPNLYLGITFNSDPAGEMTPRVQLQSVPFAYNADKVGGFTASQLVQLSPSGAQSGAINLTGGGTFGGLTTLNAGESLAGSFNQTYSSAVTGNAHAIQATNTNNTNTTSTVNGEDIKLIGGTNSNNANVLNGIDLENVAALANNTFNAINLGTGYNSLLTYNNNTIINGSGLLQNFAFDPTQTYGNLQKLGTVNAGTWQGNAVAAQYGGTGVNGATAANGAILIGNGNGYTLATLTNSGGLTITNGVGSIGLAVNYGALASTAAQGNTALTFTPSSGNLTGSLSGTAGGGLTTTTLAVVNNPTFSGLISANGGVTLGAGQNLTMTSGAGTYTQTYTSGATNTSAHSVTATNSNATGTATTVNGENISLVGTASGANTINGVNLANVTAITGNTFNALSVGTGYTNLLSYNGQSLINGSGILQNTAFSTGTSYTNLTQVGALISGSIASGFGTISTANTITGTQLNGTTGIYTGTGIGTQRIDNVGNLLNIATITATGSILDSDTADMVLDLTGAPDTTSTDSLVQLGGTGFSGNTVTNGGTYIGINEPASGAGSVADFENYESNGVSKFKIDSLGDITSAGGYAGGVYNPGQFSDTTASTHTVTNDALVYDLSTTSGTTAASFLTTFNITGLPATDGAIAFITFTCAKGAASGTRTHTCVAEIGGAAITQTLSASSAGTAVTITHTFIVARIGGVWTLMGEAPAALVSTTTSTVTTADYAEWIDFSGDARPQPGDVLSIGSDPQTVTDASKPYDPATLGVVSTTPYVVGGADDGHSVIIALTGRVPVNVNLANGPIKAGDPLTASSIPGQAMKATQPGRIIGVALSSYDGSQANSQVMVQLGVGYDDPTSTGPTAGSATNNGIITANLTGNGGGLDLNSGSNGDVSIDTSADTATLNIGTGNADGVSLSRDGQTTTVNGSLVIDQASTLKGPVNMEFANNDSLNVSTTGTGNGILVQQSNSGNATGLSGALTIDNANPTVPVAAAIRITNTGGGGYTNLVTSPNFNVTGDGNISASSLELDTASSNAFKVSNKQGATVVSIDDTGNASFAGALNLSDANLSGALNVGGNVNVGGLSTFQKLATFLAKTVFRQDVEFDGHITVASDTAGYASLRAGESSVHVTFARPYANPPVIDLSIVNGQFVLSSVNNVTDQGFDVELQSPATAPTTFSWTALAVNNPQTATNPLPAALSQSQPNTPTAKTTQP